METKKGDQRLGLFVEYSDYKHMVCLSFVFMSSLNVIWLEIDHNKRYVLYRSLFVLTKL